VRRMRNLRPTAQMSLFGRRMTIPRWVDLPTEARQQAVALLARLLRLHRHGLLTERLGREARDE